MISREDVLGELLVSRNKLVEDLLVELDLTEAQFQKGLALRANNHSKDKEVWGKYHSQESERAGK